MLCATVWLSSSAGLDKDWSDQTFLYQQHVLDHHLSLYPTCDEKDPFKGSPAQLAGKLTAYGTDTAHLLTHSSGQCTYRRKKPPQLEC